jgi:DNA-binding SARP family transcriptional activator
VETLKLTVVVLGEPCLRVGAVTTRIGSTKQRSLLALLGLAQGQTVSVPRLVDGLWGADPPRAGTNTLQSHVSGLRRLLPEGLLLHTGGGYRLGTDHGVDVTCFEALVATGRAALEAGDTDRAVETLGQALGLWSGPALLGVADTPVLAAAAQRLEESRRNAQEQLGAARLAAGAHHEVIGEFESAVAEEPLRERRWALLMTALYRSGRQADALRAYQQLRHVLADQLGINPSVELAALEQAILRQAPALDLTPPHLKEQARPA